MTDSSSIDLHGLHCDEAVEMLEETLSQAMQRIAICYPFIDFEFNFILFNSLLDFENLYSIFFLNLSFFKDFPKPFCIFKSNRKWNKEVLLL